MNSNNANMKAEQFFNNVLKRPKLIIIIGIAAIVGLGFMLPKTGIDASVEAFIDSEHHSLVYRNEVKEMFGLSDPIIVAVVNEEKNGVFNPNSLNLVSWLTDKIQKIEGVDPERIKSISTENNIFGTDDGMIVEPFIEEEISTQEQALKIKKAVNEFPIYMGNLVSKDGEMTVIVVELLDKSKYGADVYKELLELVNEGKALKEHITNEKIHIAGEAAVVEHLGIYVQEDPKRTMPVAFVLMTIVLFVAYRTLRGVLLSNLIVMCSLLGAVSIMAGFEIPFFLPSPVLLIIIITLAIADSIHLFGYYYEYVAKNPDTTSKEATLKTMGGMWRPVTVTSVTTILGFLAMGFASTMPPLRAIGIYSSIGIFIALIYSLFILPAFLMLLKPQESKVYKSIRSAGNGKIYLDWFGRITVKMGTAVLKWPRLTIILALLTIGLGLIGAFKVELNDSMVEYFNKKEDIYISDKVLNEKLDGTNFFDVVIETPEVEGLFNLEKLKKIESLQKYLESFPNVQGTTSIVDFLKQMNRSLNENKNEMYSLPDSPELVAQFFLLYSASSDPTDFENYVDYDYQNANVRVAMSTGEYKYTKDVIEGTQDYIQKNLATSAISAKISGWQNVIYYWIKWLKSSHIIGVILALFSVWLVISISFKSSVAGLYAVLPVIVAVFLNYSVMGFLGMWLNVATTVTAAIAIGIGVDSTVHVIDRLIVSIKDHGKSVEEALVSLYPSIGRALLFNVMALILGFGVNIISKAPPWHDFGWLSIIMIAAAFLGSLTLLPAMIKIFKPKFLSTKNIESK